MNAVPTTPAPRRRDSRLYKSNTVSSRLAVGPRRTAAGRRPLVHHQFYDLVQVLNPEVVGVGPFPELVAAGACRRHLLDLAPQRLDLCLGHDFFR